MQSFTGVKNKIRFEFASVFVSVTFSYGTYHLFFRKYQILTAFKKSFGMRFLKTFLVMRSSEMSALSYLPQVVGEHWSCLLSTSTMFGWKILSNCPEDDIKHVMKLITHIWIHIYNEWIHTYVHTYMITYIYGCTHSYIHACMHACLNIYIHKCMHTYIWIHSYVNTYVRTYMHTWCFNTYILRRN